MIDGDTSFLSNEDFQIQEAMHLLGQEALGMRVDWGEHPISVVNIASQLRILKYNKGSKP